VTITEKILAAHAGKEKVSPGELLNAKVDLILANDITAPIAISEFGKTGAKKVFDNKRVALIPDHFAPQKDIKAAEQCKLLREFSKEQDLDLYFEVGRMGIEHVLLPEQGIVVPGDLVIGADSHTCTYGGLGAFATGVGSTDVAAAMASGECWFKVPESMKFIYYGKLNKWVGGKDLILHTIGDIGVDGALYRAMEFEGEVINSLPMYGRLTMCNMAIEAGGKNAIIGYDNITKEYLDGRLKGKLDYTPVASDPDAAYVHEDTIDCSALEPLVAFPHLPSNGRKISDCAGEVMDQCYIGSCTNGRIEDYRIAASIMKGKQVQIRTLIVPTTPTVWRQANDEGLLNIFQSAGCVVSAPTCGACLGGFMGVLGAGEKCVSTTNRNFVGRMGHPTSEVYLCNPATAAASAIEGKLADPRNYL
jgi:3-isopropylmalate/(R)-2-methylmalate dehydratase large subunit